MRKRNKTMKPVPILKEKVIDLAAEQLAGIFIEQAKYNRLHKKKDESFKQISHEKINLDLYYKWEPVLFGENQEYHYPCLFLNT